MTEVRHLINLDEKRKYYTPKEIAESLNVSNAAVTNWLNKGKIKGFRLGSSSHARWRVTAEEVYRFVEECTYG